jgi:hypothetical protein
MNEEKDANELDNIPLEEMKYLEWKSDSSEYDNEGFKLVIKRKGKNPLRQEFPKLKKEGKTNHLILLMTVALMQEGCLELVLDTASGKMRIPTINRNDRHYMEL